MNILLIEDQPSTQKAWKLDLELRGHTVAQALDPNQAIKLFDERTDWDIIVLDGCIGLDYEFNCLPVLYHIRKTFKGHVIAASSNEDYRRLMVQNGCSEKCPKNQVVGLIEYLQEV